jgi:lysophospholipase L1-like esterase
MKNNIGIIMLGDSITNRGDWKKLLENHLVLNFGIDGDTTTGVLKRLDNVLEFEPKIIVLMIGINDLCVSIPLEQVFENYIQIVEKIKSKNIRIIINATLITRMPAINKKVISFNEMIKSYANKSKIEFININGAFEDDNRLLREDLTTDGLHLGQKAYKVLAYKLKGFIEQTVS